MLQEELKKWKYGYYSFYMTVEGINLVLYDCRYGRVEEKLFDNNEDYENWLKENTIMGEK